jgi:hypothetical protein
MSLEWARARLLQHGEALRKLCEAQVAVQVKIVATPKRPCAPVTTLRPGTAPGAVTDPAATGTVLKFAQPRRRRA